MGGMGRVEIHGSWCLQPSFMLVTSVQHYKPNGGYPCTLSLSEPQIYWLGSFMLDQMVFIAAVSTFEVITL